MPRLVSLSVLDGYVEFGQCYGIEVESPVKVTSVSTSIHNHIFHKNQYQDTILLT